MKVYSFKWIVCWFALAIWMCPLMSWAADNDYLDTSLPDQAPVVPYEGERYAAEVPDTLDLVQHAHYALNQATRLWAEEWDYEQLVLVHTKTNPPLLEMGHGGLLNCGPKVIEALPMLRVMTGSTFNIDQDGKAMGSILKSTGKDGLGYQPVENRPWAFFDEPTRKIGKPYNDIFGEARQSLAFAAWYQHDGNPMWKELAARKDRRLGQMTLKKFDTDYFRLSRGYTPWDVDPTSGPVVPIGDHNVYDASKGMVGTPASYIVGWMPQAGAIWYRLTDDPEFMKLSGGLARYLYLYGEMIDMNNGKFLADHESHISHSLLSNLSWALTTRHQPMIEWVKRGYEYQMQLRDADKTGVVFGKEACSVSDVVGLGVMLSLNGVGDYWENVDRWVRNTFLDMQVTSDDWINSKPAAQPELKPGFLCPEDAAERLVGIWRITMENHDISLGCCNGNCSRILYYVWDSILTNREDELLVNLHLNRASPWADVDSWLPYEGKVGINMKVNKKMVHVRIPEWTDQSRAACTVNGSVRERHLENGYLNVGSAKAGDRIVVSFPMNTRTIKSNLDGVDRECILKGNTLTDMQPATSYPIENHVKYQSEKAPMKKVEQFVSSERFMM